MPSKRISIILGFCLFLMMSILFGCKSKSKSNLAKTESNTPLVDDKLWLTMMDSTGVNYNKAVASFEAYWADKEKPTEADGEGQDLYETDKEKDAPAKPIDFVYEYKRFLNWQERNKNLVKPDGTVMSPEEVIEQWKKTKSDTLTR